MVTVRKLGVMLTNLVPRLDVKWDVQKGASVG